MAAATTIDNGRTSSKDCDTKWYFNHVLIFYASNKVTEIVLCIFISITVRYYYTQKFAQWIFSMPPAYLCNTIYEIFNICEVSVAMKLIFKHRRKKWYKFDVTSLGANSFELTDFDGGCFFVRSWHHKDGSNILWTSVALP